MPKANRKSAGKTDEGSSDKSDKGKGDANNTTNVQPAKEQKKSTVQGLLRAARLKLGVGKVATFWH